MIKTYAKGNRVRLSEHFVSTEFDCSGDRCCSKTYISDEIYPILEQIRTHFGNKPLTITSGYRCIVHNNLIGGSRSSQHLTGNAVDFKIAGVDPLKIAIYTDSVLGNKGGIELGSYDAGKSGYIHLDVRTKKWRAIRPNRNSTGYTSYSSMTPQIRAGVNGACVTVFTRKLKKLGYLKKVYSSVSNDVISAIKSFQKSNGLTVDGIAGSKTWSKLAEKL